MSLEYLWLGVEHIFYKDVQSNWKNKAISRLSKINRRFITYNVVHISPPYFSFLSKYKCIFSGLQIPFCNKVLDKKRSDHTALKTGAEFLCMCRLCIKHLIFQKRPASCQVLPFQPQSLDLAPQSIPRLNCKWSRKSTCKMLCLSACWHPGVQAYCCLLHHAHHKSGLVSVWVHPVSCDLDSNPGSLALSFTCVQSQPFPLKLLVWSNMEIPIFAEITISNIDGDFAAAVAICVAV